MVCRNCGNEMRDDAKFCPSCGALNAPAGSGLPQGAAPYSAPAAPAWEAPEGGGKKKTGLFIGVGVVVVALVALAAAFASGLFASPKGAVEKAFLKSAAAYAAAEEKLGVPDMEQWQKDQKVNLRTGLELQSINSDLVGMDVSALNGLGLTLGTSYDGEGRTMSIELNAYWDSDDLFTFQMAADDNELYFNSPQFTGDTFYGMDTETLGADLAEMTGDDSVQNISFNLFDLVDLMLERMDQEAMEEGFQTANKNLWAAASVKKTGAKTLNINGTSTKTTAYRVTIPQAALDQYIDELETMLSAMNYYDLYEELYQSMGMPQDQIDEIMSALEELDVYGELADSFHDAAEELGDVVLDIYLSGGYVSAVEYQIYLDNGSGSFLKLSLFLGGGEEYVDDLRLELKVDDQMFVVDSTGDHGLKSGVFTDETVIKGPFPMITSEMTLDPSKEKDNFQWKLSVSDSGMSMFVLDTSGHYQAADDYLSLRLNDVSLRTMGMEVCNLTFDYYVDCHPGTMTVTDPRLITQMNELELQQVGMDIQTQAMAWVLQMQQLFTSRLPEDLLWAMMS